VISTTPAGVNHYVAPAPSHARRRRRARRTRSPATSERRLARPAPTRPCSGGSLVVVAVVLLMAIWPTLFTQVPPTTQLPAGNSNGGLTGRASARLHVPRLRCLGPHGVGRPHLSHGRASSPRSSARSSASSWARSRGSTAAGSTRCCPASATSSSRSRTSSRRSS
jgi:hypothetical protein